ncbi:RB1-inducible coiled-coil protein 1-like [Schistocerca cancellata]|uniref:RB1-inducible coiled-coil protein 1-like n=1 Tax=Schistocerca cancellata TaxID=274614 RepID=UPI0021173E2B|nr:RB1-inducible coiled-coil protein 1-like [Schistocerca cancellata]
MSKFTTISEDFTKPYQKCSLKEHHQAEMKEKASFNYSSSETCSSSSVSKGKQCHINSKRDMYSGRQSRIPTYIKPFGRRSSTNSVNVNNQCSKTDNQNCLLKLNKTISERNISEYTKDSNLGNKMKCNKQSELQTEREKVRKHAVCIRRLKSELQLMKNSMVEYKKPLVLGHNSQLSRQRNNSVSAPHSPHHYSFTAAEFQKQVNELEQKVNEDHALRFSLEVQVNKMRYELQEKFNIEKELMLLQNKLENDFVSKTEMDAVKRNYEAALAKARQDAELSVYDDLRHKLHQINIFIENQAQEQANITHLQNINESQMQQEFKEISLKILSDFAKVQATLQEKDEKEKELKEKYEKLIKECEKEQEVQRKKLIEKSYSVNLTPYMNKKVKDVNSKSCMLDISSSQHSSSLQSLCARHSTLPIVAVPHSSNSPWVPDNALNYILHREMEDSISKNSSSDDAAIQSSTNKPLSATEEQLEILRLKYFVY